MLCTSLSSSLEPFRTPLCRSLIARMMSNIRPRLKARVCSPSLYIQNAHTLLLTNVTEDPEAVTPVDHATHTLLNTQPIPSMPSPPNTTFSSQFLALHATRDVPVGLLGLSNKTVSEFAFRIVCTVSAPQSAEAKLLIRHCPQAVLFAQQVHLANAHGETIEAMADRAVTRGRHYHDLSHLEGPERACLWLRGRDTPQAEISRRLAAEHARLSFRRGVVLAQANKAYRREMINKVNEALASVSV